MIEAVLAGVVAGYAIAIPVGAIAVLIIHIGMTGGLRAGLAAAAGAASADAIYVTLAVLAGYGISALVGPLIGPLRICGGLVLVAIGARGLYLAWRARHAAGPARAVTAHAVHGRTYLELLGLTLLNPATVVYFAALAVGLPFLGGLGERFAFAAAAFLASLSWQVLLAGFGTALGRGAGHRLRQPTMLLGNVVVIGFGLVVLAGANTLPA